MEREAYVEMAQVQDIHWWFRGRREILRSVICGLGLPESPSILSIGCGTGGNLKMLMEFGRVKAVEMNDYARSIARQRTQERIDIRAGRLPDQIPFVGPFDLVCLFDVLEHVECDVDSLIAIRSLVTERGFLLLTVPAYSWMWSAHDERLHHFRRYNARQLRGKAQAADWSVNKLTYYNTLLFPLAVIARLVDKALGRKQASGTGIPPAPLNAFFYRVFSSEKYWLRLSKLPFGVSLMAQLSKK